MGAEYPAESDRDHTAIHEAGHAVLMLILGLGQKGATIVPNFEDQVAGSATHGGEYGDEGSDTEKLHNLAEEAFLLRHAIADYAGKEAVRQIRLQDDADTTFTSDEHDAVKVINQITGDPKSCDLLFALAKRRCTLLVEYYRPEIEAVAAALLSRDTMSGEEVQEIVAASTLARRASLLRW